MLVLPRHLEDRDKSTALVANWNMAMNALKSLVKIVADTNIILKRVCSLMLWQLLFFVAGCSF